MTRDTSPPRRVRPLIRQSWREVGFLHWAFEPKAVQRVLPPRLEVDTHNGLAWVSIVCFSTTCSVMGPIPLPGPMRYPETNVRTYVRAPDGTDGLFFFSLDVTNRANVMLGKATGLRYRLADMEVQVSDTWSYRGTRRDASGAHYNVVVQPEPGDASRTLDLFLTARWSGYAQVARRLIRYDVQHQRWPLRRAAPIECEQTLLATEGLPQPTAEPLAHVSTGVDANLAPHRLIL